MNKLPLERARVRVNEPLPFAVFDADGALLLARGQVLQSEEQVQRLVERGAYVDGEEARAAGRVAPDAPAAEPACEAEATIATLARVQSALKDLLFRPLVHPQFKDEVARSSGELTQVVERSPDCALYHLMNKRADQFYFTSIAHAIQCAVVCHLVAARLGWSQAERDSLVSAALTMNVAMTEVHGTLAAQGAPPTERQREIIREHPLRGAEILRALGVVDPDWLRAVEEHHEKPDGSGYPRGIAASFEPAEILRYVDIFVAKLDARANRPAIAPHKAVRDIFMNLGNNRISAAVIKEFGLYPPGAFVHLASGELAVVVARGESVNKPLVAALANNKGEALLLPVRRDTADPQYAVCAVVDSHNVLVHIDPAKLYP